jgi:nucleotide-binding universal stress UspA family protein
MTQPVLCAIDITETALTQRILLKASKLAKLEQTTLDVVTVLPDFGMSMVSDFFTKDHSDSVIAKAKDQLHQIVEDTLGSDQASTVRHLVVTGNAYEEILNVAKQANSSLIVIGAHKPDFTDFLLGPNAARVVRHSSCSVMVIR